MLSPSEVPVKYVLGSRLRSQIRSARFPRYRCLRNNRPSQKIMVVPPPFPPDPKLNNWPANLSASVCEINAQSSKGPRPIFFNFGSGGGEGGNVLKNIKYKWAIILQTPVPGKLFSSGLVLQPRAQTTNSRVLFCFRFRAAARNEGPPSAGPSEQRKA